MFTDVYKTLDPIHRQLALDTFLSGKNRNTKLKTMIGVYEEKGMENDYTSEMMIDLRTIHNEKQESNNEMKHAWTLRNDLSDIYIFTTQFLPFSFIL